MKKTIVTIAIAGAAAGASADILSDLSISGTFDYESEYVYRASKITDHSFQPSIELGYPVLGGDLYVGLWTNQPISNVDVPFGPAGFPVGNAKVAQGNEIDFYAGYAYPVTDIFTVDVGATYYWYPESAGYLGINHTTEIYFGVSADVLLSPAVYFYYDFDLQQTLVEFSIGYSLDLGEYIGAEGLSIDTGAYLGLLNTGDTSGGAATTAAVFPGLGAPIGADSSNGYTYGGITADLVYAFTENVSGSIGVRWSINNDGSTGPANTVYAGGPTSESQVWFGSTLGFAY